MDRRRVIFDKERVYRIANGREGFRILAFV
jgi:hypothetical protein